MTDYFNRVPAEHEFDDETGWQRKMIWSDVNKPQSSKIRPTNFLRFLSLDKEIYWLKNFQSGKKIFFLNCAKMKIRYMLAARQYRLIQSDGYCHLMKVQCCRLSGAQSGQITFGVIMSDAFSDTINTAIWAERAEPDNPFVAQQCLCRGYDVFGDVLGQASFIDYLYLLFKGERPTPQQAKALEMLAIAFANPGPRDPSVHAAMAAYVSGTPAATALVAALSVGAGAYQGAREIFLAMQMWQTCGTDLSKWQLYLPVPPAPTRTTIWPQHEAAPGFDSYGTASAKPVQQLMQKLMEQFPAGHLQWLCQHQQQLESLTNASGQRSGPLNLFGVIAAALMDLNFTAQEAEMLTLLLRLPGAAVHALEQKQRGFRQFPFFALDLATGAAASPQTEEI